jgi:hypothetical protein
MSRLPYKRMDPWNKSSDVVPVVISLLSYHHFQECYKMFAQNEGRRAG